MKSESPSCSQNTALTSTKEGCELATGRPQFGLKSLLVFVALAAGLLALRPVQNAYSSSVLGVMAMTWFFGCRRSKQGVLLIAPTMLLPYLWLLIIQYPWNDYRWYWVKSWGCLPGLFSARLLSNEESIYFVLATLIATVMFLTAVSMIRFWPISRWWIVGTVLLLNLVLSGVLYNAFWF